MANKSTSVLKDTEAREKPSAKQGGLVVNGESYSVFISSEAKMMVSTQNGAGGKLIVNSKEDKENLLAMLGKNEDKLVNQDMKKFCEDNGIDMSQPIEKLESFIVIRTAEMERKDAMYTDSSLIKANAHCFVDAFNGGSFIGQYPPEAVYTMYEKRFNLYVKELTDYIDKYGRDPELRETIEKILNEKNPDGTNEVANLVKEITDRIYSDKADTVDQLIKDKAKEAYEHTYEKEIAASNEAERKRREKFMNRLAKENERIENEREILMEKIKKLQEKILEMKKVSGFNGTSESEQIRSFEKELEDLTRRLSKLHTQVAPSDDQDWSDMSVLIWGL